MFADVWDEDTILGAVGFGVILVCVICCPASILCKTLFCPSHRERVEMAQYAQPLLITTETTHESILSITGPIIGDAVAISIIPAHQAL